MRILVLGATGTVGSRALAQLKERGVSAVGAARRAPPEGLSVDLADKDALAAAARGFDAAFLVTPLGPQETEHGLAAIAGLRQAGVGKIAYISIMNLEEMAEIPHFAAKLPIKAELLADGRSIALEPNFFFQNDLMLLDLIRGAGVYGLPVGTTGVWSVSADDIARAAVNALLTQDWNGAAVPVCGPEQLTGPMLAANWAEALGRPVVYPGDAIEPLLDGLARMMPGFDDWWRRDFRLMMEVTQRQGCPASAEQRAQSQAIIGQPPISHAAFAASIAAGLPLGS
jgi:uncharacterized protein YbjT (DUF2867 family)